ncbi:ABC-2 type transporter [Sulfitobacter noctilucicola]|uniref:Capsular polysaccharide transport system permease protein n=1 Tax=Sulfitobacter noctilucicola TaxID=1342301 RepID=A0A7W6M6X3_9RHOB|nr:ABC transporter permease [Sulfitobacter noctilucicola]KIN62874.1 ABC-2 type transporter [Sulfitobacter noctilucicola]MBB4172596.1 capsular polysaccharide transport system permease protein [Sulfitobacter noctilucicola]
MSLRVHTSPFATPRAIGALILRELITTYGRSPGGYVWAVLEPAAGITLLTLVFSIGFRTPPLGTSFALFYAAGILPLMMYTDISAKLAQTVQFSQALLAYPRITFLDALIARFVLNVMTQMMVHFIVLGFILIYLKPTTTLDYSKIGQAYGLTLVLALGVGTLNSFLTLAYPIWNTAWSILNRPLFLVSCVFFIFETVPQPYSDYLWFNPIVHIAGLMRDGFYPFYQPTYVSKVYPLAIAALTAMAGLFLLNRYHRDILDK